MKGGPFEVPWPTPLVLQLQRYLDLHRPRLLGGLTSERLWISSRGTPLTYMNLYHRIVALTKRLFGAPIPPHWFRDCAMTSIAVEDPGHVGIGPSLLAHSDHRTGKKYYNQAKALVAGRRHQQNLRELQRKLELLDSSC